MCPLLSSIEPSQLVVNPVGLEASIPVRISTRGEGDPIPDVVMPAVVKMNEAKDQPMALRALFCRIGLRETRMAFIAPAAIEAL